MTYQNFVKAQLVEFAVREAHHHGGTANMVAAAQVIANRVRAGWQGGDWLSVLLTAPAFAGTIYPRHGLVQDVRFRLMLQKVEDIFHGGTDQMTEGALYFAELHNLNRPWFAENILANLDAHPRLAQVGPVTFFG